MSAIKTQTPSYKRGDLGECEQELLSKSSGALICLYSEDMVPLVSVAHGMQLPRAQIGLLGACFTSCRSNSFELSKVRAGDSTISYRSILGGRILVVVVLSSWGGSSGILLDMMLKQMHDSVLASIRLVAGERALMQLLEAGKVSQVRKLLKPATQVFQHLLTRRTDVQVLTRSVGAVPHLRASQSVRTLISLEDACGSLSLPGGKLDWCACVLCDGKLLSATRSWCHQIARGPHGEEGRGGRGGGGVTEEREVEMLVVHMFASIQVSESNVALQQLI
jgi:hypothetical protein